jgi:hypothetical protein
VQNKKRQNQAFWSETIVDGNASLAKDATAEAFGKDPAIGENIDTILGKVETKLGSVSVHRLLGFDRASKQKGLPAPHPGLLLADEICSRETHQKLVKSSSTRLTRL